MLQGTKADLKRALEASYKKNDELEEQVKTLISQSTDTIQNMEDQSDQFARIIDFLTNKFDKISKDASASNL